MTLAPPEPAPTESEARDHGVDFIPLPAVTFNSDTGFGLGAVLQLFVYAKDHRPYAHGITAQFFATTTGFQGHYITWDAPRLLGPVRVEAHAEYHRDPYAPYYGPGNNTFPGQVLEGPDRFFGYINGWTWDWIRFRIKPLGRHRAADPLRRLPVPLPLDHPLRRLEPRQAGAPRHQRRPQRRGRPPASSTTPATTSRTRTGVSWWSWPGARRRTPRRASTTTPG